MKQQPGVKRADLDLVEERIEQYEAFNRLVKRKMMQLQIGTVASLFVHGLILVVIQPGREALYRFAICLRELTIHVTPEDDYLEESLGDPPVVYSVRGQVLAKLC